LTLQLVYNQDIPYIQIVYTIANTWFTIYYSVHFF